MKTAWEMDDKEFADAVRDAGLAVESLVPRDCKFLLCVVPETGQPRFATTIRREYFVPQLQQIIADYTDKENK